MNAIKALRETFSDRKVEDLLALCCTFTTTAKRREGRFLSRVVFPMAPEEEEGKGEGR